MGVFCFYMPTEYVAGIEAGSHFARAKCFVSRKPISITLTVKDTIENGGAGAAKGEIPTTYSLGFLFCRNTESFFITSGHDKYLIRNTTFFLIFANILFDLIFKKIYN